MKKWNIAIVTLLLLGLLTACGGRNQENNTTASPNHTVTNSPAPDLPDSIEDAGEDMKNGAENIGEDMKDGMENTGDAIKDAGENIKDDMTGETNK